LANLTNLSVANNQITDITALTGKTKLFTVVINDNPICSIAPLASSNPWVLNVTNDCLNLSPGSPDMNKITALQAQYSFVYYSPQRVVTVTPSAGAHGTISPGAQCLYYHTDCATFTITPDTGYHVADVLVDGASVGATSTYQFTDVSANRTISATFAVNE